ncbi:TonB-dependent receptor [Stakelama sediminis]|nr:TonB-dependent receptor [Stakelama sediminis]
MKTMLLAGAACLIATPVFAQTSPTPIAQQRIQIDLPAQPLSAALFQISRSTGLQLIFTDSAITRLRAPELSGKYTAREMLDVVLSGSGYTYRYTAPDAVRIVRAGRRNAHMTAIDYSAAVASSAAKEGGQTGTATTVPQSAPASVPSADEGKSDIVVVGTQIQGSKVAEALPVTVLNSNQIAATGAVSGDELLRSIPQLGDVSFNSAYLPQSSNAARGDVGSINLRNLGVGNTLLLIDGRRVVHHPTSRANDQLVPVLTYNANAIPVAGIQRLEVLRDGAAAIYGSDAVAGVVNVVLQKDYQGASVSAQYGLAEGTGLHEFSANGIAGTSFANGAGNVTVFADYTHRSMLRAEDQYYTASDDKRDLFAGTRFDGSTSLDGRSTTTPWGYFGVVGASGGVYQNGTRITSSSGLFHIQPQTNPDCSATLPNGICIGSGSAATSTVDRNLRYDRTASSNETIMPETDRGNLYATAHYEIAPDVVLFGEGGLYLAKTRSWQYATYNLSSIPITVPASNYYNPFGAVTLPDGSPNPNRLPGLTNVPDEGLPVTLKRYDFSDTGPNLVEVTNSEYRLVGGIRWHMAGFKFESAALYSEARVHDRTTALSATLVQQALALSTPDAYDPFNGGNLENPSIGDTTKSNQATIDAMKVYANRIDKSTLASWDIKASRPDLIHLPGGDLGIAIGAEVRRETQSDDRDPRADGTITFTDSVTGETYGSDIVGTSPSPDVFGRRTVESAYAELAIPVISPDMHVPLAYNVELQLAGRFEHYSDAGSVAKPKIAGAWDIVDGLRIRGSYSEGFKAPNLEQVNATVVTRSNTRTDYIRCEADLIAGRISSFNDCSETQAVISQRSGNPDLKPETSKSWTVGVVLQPKFIPSRFGQLTITADYWHVHQEGMVGIFGDSNSIIKDYLLRTQGSSDPDVVRATPTADDIAEFAGTGIDPVGEILYVKDAYRNLLPQTAEGIDLGLIWSVRDTGAGDFTLNLNAAHLGKFYLSPSPDISALMSAQNAGDIDPSIYISGGGDLLRQNGKPEWKLSGSLTWSLKQFQVGGYTQYTSSVDDTGLIDDDGNPWLVSGRTTVNLYGQVTIGAKGSHQYRLRIGARNLFDVAPPLSSNGYEAALYNPYGRYLYVNVRATL